MKAEREAMAITMTTAIKAAEETARRLAFDNFLAELKVEQRHYTRENRMLMNNRKSLVLQERMYFRNIPLSDWIEHEIMLDEGADVDRLVQDMTVFDKGVVSIADVPRRNNSPDAVLERLILNHGVGGNFASMEARLDCKMENHAPNSSIRDLCGLCRVLPGASCRRATPRRAKKSSNSAASATMRTAKKRRWDRA